MADHVKRICIISRAQIRYEGDFVSVEYHESCGRTITLANVKSFGSEDRPAEKKIPSKDVIYDKIMFTENDLVSITFIEENNVIDDPSIVVAQPRVNSNIAPIGTKPTSSNNQKRDQNDGWNNSENLKFEEKNPQTSQRVNAWAANSRPQNHVNSTNTNNWPNNNPSNDQGRNKTQHYQNQRNPQNYHNQNASDKPRMRHNNYNNRNHNYGNTTQNYDQQRPRYNGGNSTDQYRGLSNRPKINNYTRKEDDITFTGEYDIESANKELAAELEKLNVSDSGPEGGSIKGENDENDVPDKEEKIVYDSTKSIFDKLSSQIVDRAMGKKTVNQSFRDERKLNSTTFGNLRVYNNDSRNKNYNSRYNNNYSGGSGGGSNYRGNYRRGGRGGGDYHRNKNYHINNNRTCLVNNNSIKEEN